MLTEPGLRPNEEASRGLIAYHIKNFICEGKRLPNCVESLGELREQFEMGEDPIQKKIFTTFLETVLALLRAYPSETVHEAFDRIREDHPPFLTRKEFDRPQ